MPRPSKARASRSAARQLALQMLYQADLNRYATEQEIADQMRERLPRADLFDFGFGLVKGVADKRDEIDAAIDGVATNWQLHRMAATDRNLLRLGCFELRHRDTPAGVVINEAVDMAKRFGSKESPRFVNGVLDRLVPDEKRPPGWVPKPVEDVPPPADDPTAIPADATPEEVARRTEGSPIAFRRPGRKDGDQSPTPPESPETSAASEPTEAEDFAADASVEDDAPSAEHVPEEPSVEDETPVAADVPAVDSPQPQASALAVENTPVDTAVVDTAPADAAPEGETQPDDASMNDVSTSDEPADDGQEAGRGGVTP